MRCIICNVISNINQKTLNTLVAILVAIFTTGYLRVHWIPFLPESDGGNYTFFAQYIYSKISSGQNIDASMPIALYSLMTSWLYGFEINQFIALRWIDLCLALTASILFFKVIEKESGSILFTIVSVATLLLIMNDYSLVMYGFRNSIWAAYVPLFLALLISQNSSKKSYYSFYFIGALVSFGVLLREPFLVFFILGGFATLFAYGWKVLVKYIVGSVILGFTALIILIMLRGTENPLIIIEAYTSFIEANKFEELRTSYFFANGISMIKIYWFGIILALISSIYILKLYLTDKKFISIRRFSFWLALALIPIIEPALRLGFTYHFANCIPGLVGILAMTWKYISLNQSKNIQKYLLIAVYVFFIYGSYPNISKTLSIDVYQKENAVINAYKQLWKNNYNEKEIIKLSNFLIASDMIKKLSSKNSTLATAGFATPLYPITGLLPPSFDLYDLRGLYSRLNWDEDKLVKILKEQKPTIIMPTKQILPGMPNLTRAIQMTGLYERVAIVSYSPNVYYKSITGDIYRLKSFKK